MTNVLEGVPGPIGDFMSGKHAQKSNKSNLNYIKSLFEGLNQFTGEQYGNALKGIDKIGETGKANALSQEKQALGAGSQNLAGSGLWSSTVNNSMQRGVRNDTMRSMANIDAQIAQMKSGIYTGWAGQQSQNIANLANIFGGVKYEGSHTTGDMMKALAGIAGAK